MFGLSWALNARRLGNRLKACMQCDAPHVLEMPFFVPCGSKSSVTHRPGQAESGFRLDSTREI